MQFICGTKISFHLINEITPNQPHFSSFEYSLKTHLGTKQLQVNVKGSEANEFVFVHNGVIS